MKKLNQRLILTALLLAALLAAVFAGCSKTTPEPSPTGEPDKGITVVDMKGREIKLDGPANRIVALTAGDCEIIFALGAGDKLVGRGAYCDYPEEVLEIPAVDSGGETNIEQIIALEPQVVIMSTMAQTIEHVESLERAGIRVVTIEAHDIEGTYEAIKIIGTVIGKNEEAAALVDQMKADFEELKSKIPPNSGKKIYFEVSPLEYGLWAAGSGTFMDELANMLGLTNIFSDVQGWAQVSEEQVLERNPDLIVSNAMFEGAVEEIAGRSGWENLNAVKNGKILNTYNNEITRPGPRLVDGARMLFDFAYGD